MPKKDLLSYKLQESYARFEFAKFLTTVSLITLVGVLLIIQVNEKAFSSANILLLNFIILLLFLFLLVLLIFVSSIHTRIKGLLKEMK